MGQFMSTGPTVITTQTFGPSQGPQSTTNREAQTEDISIHDKTTTDSLSSSSPPSSLSINTDQTVVEQVVPPRGMEEQQLGRGLRQRTQSVRLKEFVVNTAPKNTAKQQTSKSNYPIANYVDCERFSPQHQAYLAAITSGIEPKSFKEAMEDERWNKAMLSEIEAQERNQSWTVVDLPKGKKAIGCKWVYKLKYKSDGILERHKARLVALGNKQIEGVDYGETFAPVAKMGTIRLFLDTAVKRKWYVHQMDVHNAFLHGDLEEEIYMKLPPGFNASSPGKFMQQPREDHWHAALRVVRYLKGSPGQGILLRANDSFQLSGWCDNDWASCPLTRRSVTGYFIQLGGSPISWKTRKQKTVSRSSAEAEYRALAFLSQELIWLKRILSALGVNHIEPMIVNCDSKAAIHIATNPVFHERTKHVELDCHFVRDEVVTKNIGLQHVDSKSQLVDIFTKPLGKQEYDQFRFKLGIRDLHTPA